MSEPIVLDARDALRLLAAQKAVSDARLDAAQAAAKAAAAVKAAAERQARVFDELAAKYGLNPSLAYVLDDEALTLTIQERN